MFFDKIKKEEKKKKSYKSVLRKKKSLTCFSLDERIKKKEKNRKKYCYSKSFNLENVPKPFFPSSMRKIMTVKTMKEFKKSMDFYKFLIVREPLERLLSAYRDRIEDTSHRSWQRENYVPKILKVTRPHLKVWGCRLLF